MSPTPQVLSQIDPIQTSLSGQPIIIQGYPQKRDYIMIESRKLEPNDDTRSTRDQFNKPELRGKQISLRPSASRVEKGEKLEKPMTSDQRSPRARVSKKKKDGVETPLRKQSPDPSVLQKDTELDSRPGDASPHAAEEDDRSSLKSGIPRPKDR